MTEHRTLADKTRMLTKIIQEIKWCPSGVAVPGLVDAFNVLALPKGYVYVDPDTLVHVIMIQCTRDIKPVSDNPEAIGRLMINQLGTGVAHTADVVWHFDPVERSWVTVKDRTGDFQARCPIFTP